MNSSAGQRRQKRTRVAVTAAAVVVVALMIGATAEAQRRDCAPPVKALSTGSFDDVPSSYWAYTVIQNATDPSAGLMSGCGATYFCPGEFVMREDLAVSLERGMRGPNDDPGAPAAAPAADVSATYCLAGWVAQLLGDEITPSDGCSSGYPCPNTPPTRAEAREGARTA